MPESRGRRKRQPKKPTAGSRPTAPPSGPKPASAAPSSPGGFFTAVKSLIGKKTAKSKG